MRRVQFLALLLTHSLPEICSSLQPTHLNYQGSSLLSLIRFGRQGQALGTFADRPTLALSSCFTTHLALPISTWRLQLVTHIWAAAPMAMPLPLDTLTSLV